MSVGRRYFWFSDDLFSDKRVAIAVELESLEQARRISEARQSIVGARDEPEFVPGMDVSQIRCERTSVGLRGREMRLAFASEYGFARAYLFGDASAMVCRRL